MKIKAIKKLPGRWKVPGVDNKQYRGLQQGNIVDVDNEAAEYLLKYGYCEKSSTAEVINNIDATLDEGGES